MITRAHLLLLIVLTSGIALAAQKPARDAASVAPATGTAAIGGVLVAADTGKPVRRARVNLLSREPRVTRSAITDTQGRFLFVDLPAGEFALSASQPGYLDVTYGQKRPGAGGLGTPIHVVDHQRVDRLSLRIPRGGVLTGTVLDDNNDPVFGAQVRAFRYVMRTGERTLEPEGTGRTDDRGSYRIPALPPGDYIVTSSLTGNGAAPMEVNFRVRTDGPRPLLLDIGVAGIWLAPAQQAEFLSVLARNNGDIKALSAHLRVAQAQ
ncbi:MAG: carboxypeptidase regulatory-like domain-containing protein [Acidobacteriota bacterium]